MKKQVTTYYLEMTTPDDLVAAEPVAGFSVQRCQHIVPEFNQFMFRAVGGPWRWYSRLGWDYAAWLSHLTDERVTTFMATYDGSLAGYFELFTHPDNSVELHFFGLLPTFYGKGLGSRLLVEAIQSAWSLAPERVWVHTCSEDHKYALANYERRGFHCFNQQTEWEELPEDDSPQWLTAPFVFSQLNRHRG
ncbi:MULTISPECIES: GNAT family N-acetyltransferase [Corallincola]|uniref:GNAT family N-acetyltransferase n=2 Tax=Corallincola TaxID=1775176 RepID=A0ABY1WKQ4_9GAMM|nr:MULTISPECIES: GNAT family N-acetyltransferase [Corallincola]TAA40354.1 GNAT family N-acetyltransferase [Corallincola spongiicola]TCI05334.1 GNAT family N-acetyltransferase [Corallincola luteus]